MDKNNRRFLRHASVLFAALLISPSLSAAPMDELDCDQPADAVTEVICHPENPEQIEAMEQLSRRYRDLESSQPDAQANWLRESQVNWLKMGADCRDYGAWAANCLTWRYRVREEQLAIGVVSNPVSSSGLPYRAVLPNGRDGRFELVELPAEQGPKSGQELWFHSGESHQRIWTTEAAAESSKALGCTHNGPLSQLSLIALNGDNLVLEIKSGCYSETPNHIQIFHYLALDGTNTFVAQGDKTSVKTSAISYGIQYRKRWVAGEDGPRLVMDGHYDGVGFLLIHPKDHQRLYRFRFNGQPWEEQLPEPQTWLDMPDAATRYTALYRDIVAKHPMAFAEEAGCTEAGINWTLANKALDHWLDVVRDAHERGVAYGQAPAIIGKVLAGGKGPALDEGQRELFHALEYFRRRIEATEDWQRKLDAVYREAITDDGLEAYNYGEREHGFPNFKVNCLAVDDSDVDDYSIYRNYWFNTFWMRRHGDGTYEVAKKVIEYALNGHARDYQDANDDRRTPAVFDEASAMLAVFGAYNTDERGTLVPAGLTARWSLGNAASVAKPLLATTYEENKQQKGVLVVQRQRVIDGEPAVAHINTVTISVYIFSKNGERWRLESSEPEVTEDGAYGQAPGYLRLIKLGDNKHGLLFKGAHIYSGDVEQYAFIIGLSDKPVAQLVSFDMGRNNGDDCVDSSAEETTEDSSAEETTKMDLCWSYEGQLSFVRNRHDLPYYTLIVTYYGTLKPEDEDYYYYVERSDFYQHDSNGGYEKVDTGPPHQGTVVPTSEIFLSGPKENTR